MWSIVKRHIRKHFKLLILLIVVMSIQSTISLIIPIISSSFLDLLVIVKDLQEVLDYCALFAGVSMISILIGYFSHRLHMLLSSKMTHDLNTRIVEHIHRIGAELLNEKNYSHLTQQIYGDTQIVISVSLELIDVLTSNVIKVLMPIAIIARININILFVLLTLIILYILLYYCMKQSIYAAKHAALESQNVYYSKLYEQVAETAYIQIHGVYSWFVDKFRTSYFPMLRSLLNLQKIQYIYTSLDIIIVTAAQIIIFIIGGKSVLNKEITIGEFTLIFTYFSMIIGAIRSFLNIGKRIQMTQVSCDRITNIFLKPLEISGEMHVASVDTIEMDNVSFGYGNKPLVNRFSMQFRKGNLYVITGENGTGKSTLLLLLLGVIKPDIGAIYVNKIPLKDINLEKLRREKIGFVEQIPWIINDSVKNNIIHGRKELLGNMKEFSEELWLCDNILCSNEGSTLSGGEKQKIVFVRAIIKEPDVIILDEPTSALDKNSTKQLVNKLLELKENKIVVVVTHESALINIADKHIDLSNLSNKEK